MFLILRKFRGILIKRVYWKKIVSRSSPTCNHGEEFTFGKDNVFVPNPVNLPPLNKIKLRLGVFKIGSMFKKGKYILAF